MAFLISASFPDDVEGQALHAKVRKAFDTLTKSRPPKQGEGYIPYYRVPVRLVKHSRDHLKSDFEDVWTWCMFSFDEEETGASMFVSKREATIGPFFLRSGFTSVDMEKIILHEYLHAALRYGRQYHHSFIEQIIKYDLGYKGPWNPAEGVGD